MTTIARPPGPRDRAFGLDLLRDMQRDYLGFWREAQRRHGDTMFMRHAWTGHYAFLHPDQIRETLVDKAHAFIRYEQHTRVLSQVHGQSLLTTNGEVWKRQRRIVLPAFSPKRFGGYARQMTSAAAEAFNALPGDDTAVDVEHLMNMLAIDVILRTMFGDTLSGDTAPIEHAIRTLGEIGYAELFLPFPIPAWAPLPRQAEKRAALRLLDGLIRSQIRTRRAAAQADTAGDDLLGMLLAAADDEGDGRMLSDREVRDQLMTAFLAGHETTATALAWTCWALAADGEIAARAAAEVDAVLAGRTPAIEDLPQLPYLNAVVKESLRRYPPVPGPMMRRAIEDVQVGPWLVPKGSLVTIPSILTHLDARWFPEPEQFDPSRFHSTQRESRQEIPRGAYLPFGAGPHVCIGNSFAQMEMTLVLAMLLQRFTIRPAPGQQAPAVRIQVTLRPEGGVRLLLAPRRPASDTSASPEPRAASGCPFHA
jgi:cytochrome P450